MKEKETKDREPSLFPAPFTLEEKESKEREATTKEEEKVAVATEKEESRPAGCAAAAGTPSPAGAGATTTRCCASPREACGPASLNGQVDYDAFVQFFNSSMPRGGIRPIRVFGRGRRAMLMARCRRYGKEAVRDMVVHASRSAFLNGQGRDGWKADIDWLLEERNFIKVLEGRYDKLLPFPSSRRAAEDARRAAQEARRAAAKAIEEQMRAERQAERRRAEERAVSYAEYRRMVSEGLLPDPQQPARPQQP